MSAAAFDTALEECVVSPATSSTSEIEMRAVSASPLALPTPRAISWVAALCSSTAVAMVTRDAVHRADRLGNPADRGDRRVGRLLHFLDLAADILGRLAGLGRERFHFRCDDRETAAGFAGARGFDRGIERQKIGLRGDGLNEADDLADLHRGGGQFLHLAIGVLGLFHRAGGDFRR